MQKEEIGHILKKLRVSAKKTQREVAELLGRSQQVVGHWETGYAQPDANTLFLLCSIYDADINEAFGFKQRKIPLRTEAEDERLTDIIDIYNDINEDGKEHLHKTARYCSYDPEYKKLAENQKLA